MKTQNIVNISVAALLLLVTVCILQFQNKEKTQQAFETHQPIQLSQHLEIQIFEQTLPFLVVEANEQEKEQLLLELIQAQIQFNTSKIKAYLTNNQAYALVFIQNSSNDQIKTELVLLKKNLNSFKVFQKQKVISASPQEVKLAYGTIKQLSQEQFYKQTLKLAQTFDFNTN